MKYKRILIFGGPGTGKNWFGERLAEKIGYKFFDTDDIAWKKRFTVQRSWEEKALMLKKVAKKDKWIIGTGATSYVEPAVKRADLIVVLDIGFFRSTYRIVRRHIKKTRSGEEKTLSGPIKLAYLNYLHHRARRKKGDVFLEGLMLKYPKKVVVMTQREKREFLEGVWGEGF
ncbi:MAG: hypothetical protein KJ592_00910 [Nanoarchaeota archaeon]|nr:hypothetical protein [Nanoarchaeota archaeon]